jgi:thiamine-phosphate pyrophosphorylase
LRTIRQAVSLPLVGIGGLHPGNAAEIICNGADGVAVVSTIVAAEDPAQAARGLKSVIAEARRQ